MTLIEMYELDGLEEGAKARRGIWEQDSYVLVEFGDGHTRISFGFQGPYQVTEEDKLATDWELVHQ